MINVNKYRVEVIKTDGTKEAHMAPTVDEGETIAKETKDMYSYKVIRKLDGWVCARYTKFSSSCYAVESDKERSERLHATNKNLKIEANPVDVIPIDGVAV